MKMLADFALTIIGIPLAMQTYQPGLLCLLRLGKDVDLHINPNRSNDRLGFDCLICSQKWLFIRYILALLN